MKSQADQIKQKRLKEILKYNPETGDFTWAILRSGCSIGSFAGYLKTNKNSGKSYWVIGLDYKLYYAHRLAWLYVHGCSPPDQIDHIDGNGLNNKLENLRLATNAENHQNMRMHKRNTSGCVGVSWHTKQKKWMSKISSNNKCYCLYTGIDFFKAICARKSAENRFGFHSNHGSVRPL